MPANLPVSKVIRLTNTIDVPADWDNAAWLSRVINIYSINAIAKACHVSRNVIKNRIKRYSLVWSAINPSKNKNHTWHWCDLHYTKLGWSQAKCAKKAGICQQAFVSWLNHFNIPVRTAKETLKSHRNVRLWVRRLCSQLEQQPIVRRVYLRSDHVHVRFTNYFWETYYLDGAKFDKWRPAFSYYINRDDAVINNVPKVLPEYESDSFDTIYDSEGLIQQPHIIVNRNQLSNASFIEQRLALHEFCRQITRRGWIWPKHPMHVLQSDMQKLRDYKESKYVKNDTYSVFANNGCLPPPGRKILEHFFDLSDYARIFRSPRCVVKLLNELITFKMIKFNTHNLLRVFSNGMAGLYGHKRFKLYDPSVYCIIFKKLGIKGSILDITPGFGNRAIAAAINGLAYYTNPTDSFNQAIDNGLADFCGLNYLPWNQDMVDLLIYDNNFQAPDMSVIADHTRYTKRMMVFVPYYLKPQYQSIYKPESVIKIKTRKYKNPDYLFIW